MERVDNIKQYFLEHCKNIQYGYYEHDIGHVLGCEPLEEYCRYEDHEYDGRDVSLRLLETFCEEANGHVHCIDQHRQDEEDHDEEYDHRHR